MCCCCVWWIHQINKKTRFAGCRNTHTASSNEERDGWQKHWNDCNENVSFFFHCWLKRFNNFFSALSDDVMSFLLWLVNLWIIRDSRLEMRERVETKHNFFPFFLILLFRLDIFSLLFRFVNGNANNVILSCCSFWCFFSY